jgi:hypothetical protein
VDSVAAGRDLSVDAVLEGTIRRVEGRYRVSVRLIDVASGTPAWGSTFDEPSLNLLVVEDRLAERLAAALSLALGSTAKGGGTDNPEAYEAYLRGRFLTFKLVANRSRRPRPIWLAPLRQAFTAAKAAVTRALPWIHSCRTRWPRWAWIRARS